MITNTLRKGGRAFVIDAGHSYRNICKLLGGTYIDFGDYRTALCMNPFSNIRDEFIIVNGEKTTQTHFEEQLPLLKQLISQMATGSTPLSKKEETYIERAIVKAWSAKKMHSTIDDVIENLKVDDLEEKESEKGTSKDLAVALYPYSNDGMYGKYVNGVSNIDFTNNFVVLI
jgi:conjugal transfer ATP-binding protein TraC